MYPRKCQPTLQGGLSTLYSTRFYLFLFFLFSRLKTWTGPFRLGSKSSPKSTRRAAGWASWAALALAGRSAGPAGAPGRRARGAGTGSTGCGRRGDRSRRVRAPRGRVPPAEPEGCARPATQSPLFLAVLLILIWFHVRFYGTPRNVLTKVVHRRCEPVRTLNALWKGSLNKRVVFNIFLIQSVARKFCKFLLLH